MAERQRAWDRSMNSAIESAMEALRANEARFRLIADNVGDIIWTVDFPASIFAQPLPEAGAAAAAADAVLEQWRFSFVSRAAERVLGYKAHEIAGMSLRDVATPATLAAIRQALIDDFSGEITGPDDTFRQRFFDLEFRAKDGSSRWCQVLSRYLRSDQGTPLGVVGITRDVTEQRLAAEAIKKEQRLLRQLLDLHERERQLIAYEIHDGPAQQLTGALFRLQAFRETLARNPAAAWKSFDAAAQLVSRAIDETRRLISGLRPPVLDEAGIVEAVEYLVCEHRKPGGPEIDFDHDVACGRLPPPLESAIFRIVQESLQNACRHSRSDRIHVSLATRDDHIHIDVRDWGVGFRLDAVAEQCFGLQDIRERVRLLDGQVTIESAPAKGTHVSVELPLPGGIGDGNVGPHG